MTATFLGILNLNGRKSKISGAVWKLCLAEPVKKATQYGISRTEMEIVPQKIGHRWHHLLHSERHPHAAIWQLSCQFALQLNFFGL